MGALRALSLLLGPAVLPLVLALGPDRAGAGPPGPGEAALPPTLWSVTHLSLQADLRPEEGEISARAELDLAPAAGRPAPETIGFFLHENLAVAQVEVDGSPVRWSLDNDLVRFPDAPEARLVTVPVPSGGRGAGSGTVRLLVDYEGALKGGASTAARILPRLTELNLSAGWFPVLEGPQGFSFDLEVTAPAGQTLAANGVDASGGCSRAREAGPRGAAGPCRAFSGWSTAGDVLLAAAATVKRLPEAHGARCAVEVIVPPLPAGAAEWTREETLAACDLLAAWMRRGGGRAGEALPAVRLKVFVAARDGEGYARPPLVVAPARWFTEGGVDAVSSEAGEDDRRHRLYHEVAHAFAPLAETRGSDDWLNEALAEHLAIEALAARRGRESAARFVRRYLLQVAERSGVAGVVPESEPVLPLGPISRASRGDADSGLLFYRKGALVVRMIAGTLGRERFHGAVRSLREAYGPASSRRMTTGAFIASLEEASGRGLSDLRREWIEGTSLPVLEAELRVERGVRSPPRRGARFPSPAGRRSSAAARRWIVTGRIEQRGATGFHLLLPLEARGPGRRATRLVEVGPAGAEVSWPLPFRPEAVVLDPDLTVPRLDRTVQEALRISSVASRMAAHSLRGMEAERTGAYEPALRSYQQAAAVDPTAAYPWYRMGRTLVALKSYDRALEAHLESARRGRLSARERDRGRRSDPAGRWSRSDASPALGAAAVPPAGWLDPLPDLRSWNWIRIGQIHDLGGRRRAAERAYRRALRAPDFRGAHSEARHYLLTPYHG